MCVVVPREPRQFFYSLAQHPANSAIMDCAFLCAIIYWLIAMLYPLTFNRVHFFPLITASFPAIKSASRQTELLFSPSEVSGVSIAKLITSRVKDVLGRNSYGKIS
jgi:hypothetical protein